MPLGVPADSILEAKAAASMDQLKGLSVLLIDDDPRDRKNLQELFYQWRMSLTAAATEQEAFKILEEANKKETPFNLILVERSMDIRMPEMGGIETTIEIRKREGQAKSVSSSPGTKSSHIPIIALTAHAMKGDRERFLNAGMDAYVSKPVKIENLVSAIECVSPLIEDNEIP